MIIFIPKDFFIPDHLTSCFLGVNSYFLHHVTMANSELQDRPKENCKENDINGGYKCDICDQKLSSKENLSRHVLHLHSTDSKHFKCPDRNCNYKSRYAFHVTKHIGKKHPSNEFGILACPFCKNGFKTKSGLQSHVTACESSKMQLTCHICKVSLKTKESLQNHIQNRHPQENDCRSKCEFCDYKTTILSNLKRHIIEVHERLRQHKCIYSSKCFYTVNELRKHVMCMHSSDKPLKCDICDFATKVTRNLRAHIAAKHSDKEKEATHECNVCPRKFYSVTGLQVHIREIHLNVYLYKCDKCDYKTNQKKAFEDHVNGRHLLIKPYQCKLCDFRTANSVSLTRHVRTLHDIGRDKKIYQCDICDFKSAHGSSLKRHIQLKHKTKTFWNN